MSDSKEFTSVTNIWNENIEKIIKEIGDISQCYKWINMYAAEKYGSIHNYVMYLLMFLGPMAGILGTISDESRVLQNFITILSFMVGIVTAFIKFSKLEQKSLTHKTFSAKYASLEGNIRTQLSLYRSERQNAGLYLDYITSSYNNLFANAPLISSDLYAKWTEYAEKNGISIIPSINRIIDIKINVEKPPEKEDQKENQKDQKDQKDHQEINKEKTYETLHKKPKTSTSSFQDASFDEDNMAYQLKRLRANFENEKGGNKP